MYLTPRGIRNNNPLNLVRTKPRQGWLGAVPDARLTDDRFEQFIAPMYGLRAAAIVLIGYETKRHLQTPAEIIGAFAPPEENNTEAYAAFVADALGIEVDEHIDLSEPRNLVLALKAMTKEENGEIPYQDSTYEVAAHEALAATHMPT